MQCSHYTSEPCRNRTPKGGSGSNQHASSASAGLPSSTIASARTFLRHRVQPRPDGQPFFGPFTTLLRTVWRFMGRNPRRAPHSRMGTGDGRLAALSARPSHPSLGSATDMEKLSHGFASRTAIRRLPLPDATSSPSSSVFSHLWVALQGFPPTQGLPEIFRATRTDGAEAA